MWTSPLTLRTPADLKHHTLIHDNFHIDWAMWLRMAGIGDVDAHKGPSFYSSEHVLQAAAQGEGVALGRSALVADNLSTGRLVRPFALSLPAELAYYIVYPPAALKRSKVKVFRDWVMIEAGVVPQASAA